MNTSQRLKSDYHSIYMKKKNFIYFIEHTATAYKYKGKQGLAKG